MFKGIALHVFDDDFVGSGRELGDLRAEVRHSAVTAHVVIYHDRVLKNRTGPHGVIGPSPELRGRAAA